MEKQKGIFEDVRTPNTTYIDSFTKIVNNYSTI